MKKLISISALFLTAICSAPGAEYRTLPVDTYLDKMKGGWAGQMIGVSYGAPVEFRARGHIDDEELPAWKPGRALIGVGQDDLYVEMSFLEALEKYGLDITYEEAGKAFSETKYPLCHASLQGRTNVQKGIMPPHSGSPRYNHHCADIDFQIEADLFGLISPGLPRSSNAICDVFGHIMNYGDGVYGGMFMAAMYTHAFFEHDVEKVVRYGLRAIPRESVYAQTIRDALLWRSIHPNDWRRTWKLVTEKWASRPSGRCFSGEGFNVDASLNGAYVVIGLLYGNGDLSKTLEIATRCGQDSDCNPSSAAGVLCTILGFERIPEQYRAGIPAIAGMKFVYSKYSFNDLVPTCLQMARENIRRSGGCSKKIDGKEVFLIPAQASGSKFRVSG